MPTFGLVSRAGVITNSYTFDHCGPLARTVEDCALVLQALAGFDPKDAGSLRRPIPSYREALAQDLRGLRIGVLRHHWEEDIPASEDVRAAMDAALDVLRRLGAELEECRVRPLASYFDVKIIIAESEIFSVHQKDLIARPKDFGADFRSRALPSVLFTANDYVQATREHRRMMVEMEPLYARFDAFVTAGMGEAPRLADYRSVSFWQKPSLLTAWNVTGQPVLALPNGFGRNGLPLGMQIVGRPFGESTILRAGARLRAGHGVAHAAAPARAGRGGTRRRALRPCCQVRAITSSRDTGPVREGRPARGAAARRSDAGPAPGGRPYALGMVRRLRRDHDVHHEPANVFSFPPFAALGACAALCSPSRSSSPPRPRGRPTPIPGRRPRPAAYAPFSDGQPERGGLKSHDAVITQRDVIVYRLYDSRAPGNAVARRMGGFWTDFTVSSEAQARDQLAVCKDWNNMAKLVSCTLPKGTRRAGAGPGCQLRFPSRLGLDGLSSGRGAAALHQQPLGAAHQLQRQEHGLVARRRPGAVVESHAPSTEGDPVNIRPNRIKQTLAAGKVATILAGANDPTSSISSAPSTWTASGWRASTAASTTPTSATSRGPATCGGRPRSSA